jgi:hypothetical protein
MTNPRATLLARCIVVRAVMRRKHVMSTFDRSEIAAAITP